MGLGRARCLGPKLELTRSRRRGRVAQAVHHLARQRTKHCVCGRVCGEGGCCGFRLAEGMQVVSALETMETKLFVNNRRPLRGTGRWTQGAGPREVGEFGESSSRSGEAEGGCGEKGRAVRDRGGATTDCRPDESQKSKQFAKPRPAVLAQRLLQAGSLAGSPGRLRDGQRINGVQSARGPCCAPSFPAPRTTQTHQPTAIQAAIQRSPAGQRVTDRHQPMLAQHRAVETLRPEA